MDHKSDFRAFTRRERYQALETLLQWEGACNASVLGRLFNVRRENITKDLQAYRKQFPEQILYDSAARTYRPSTVFKPIHTSGMIQEYSNFLRRFDVGEGNNDQPQGWIDVGPQPHIEAEPIVFRALVHAIRMKQIIDIRYRSWNHPGGRKRRIHPHALAYSGLRWHCRAFDELTESYRDFHLGRFESLKVVSSADPLRRTGRDDKDWTTYVDVELVPNPHLSEPEQGLVKADYAMEADSLVLRSRQSMVPYLLQSYRVDPDVGESAAYQPRKHPLVPKFPEDLASTWLSSNKAADGDAEG